jgi:hypothetical protein
MSDDKQEDALDPMTEFEKKELDRIILEEAFRNSYSLLMKELTFDEMIDEGEANKVYTTVLTYDPEEGPSLIELETMIDYFLESEEYEKCAKIRDIMNEIFPETKLIE